MKKNTGTRASQRSLKRLPSRRPTQQSALRANALETLRQLDPANLSITSHQLHTILYWWIGTPTEERIAEIRRALPVLEDLIDFSIVLPRLDALKPEAIRFPIDDFLPELQKIYQAANEIICALPNGVTKAENWLLPIAQEAGADSDLEASVYFASRGKKEAIDIERLRTLWYRAICQDLERKTFGKVPANVVSRAKSGILSLSEAAELLKFNGRLWRFASFFGSARESDGSPGFMGFS